MNNITPVEVRRRLLCPDLMRKKKTRYWPRAFHNCSLKTNLAPVLITSSENFLVEKKIFFCFRKCFVAQ